MRARLAPQMTGSASSTMTLSKKVSTTGAAWRSREGVGVGALLAEAGEILCDGMCGSLEAEGFVGAWMSVGRADFNVLFRGLAEDVLDALEGGGDGGEIRGFANGGQRLGAGHRVTHIVVLSAGPATALTTS